MIVQFIESGKEVLITEFYYIPQVGNTIQIRAANSTYMEIYEVIGVICDFIVEPQRIGSLIIVEIKLLKTITQLNI